MNRPDAAAVKQAVSLLDVARGDGHVLRRSGAKLWMLCPFHDERTASCVVDERRFHCFGCGADGDLFDYIQLRDGCDFREAFRKASQMAGDFVPFMKPAMKPVPPDEPWKPYRMTDAELQRCVSMADALLRDRRAIKAIAKSRNWRRETIRGLALDACLGLHEGKLVCLYPTGAKKRFKPLTPRLEEGFHGAKFAWMFGRPDMPWRSDRLSPCTQEIHITEGETAAITLIENGIARGPESIVMAVPGASSWRDEWAGIFRGRRVMIWPDADEAGQQLRERIIACVSPCAKSVGYVPVHGMEGK